MPPEALLITRRPNSLKVIPSTRSEMPSNWMSSWNAAIASLNELRGYKYTLVLSREITDEESAILREASPGCADAVFGPDTLPTNAEIPVTKLPLIKRLAGGTTID